MTKIKTHSKQHKGHLPRKRGRRRSVRQASREILFESDSTYFLKLVAIVILGTLWIKFSTPITWLGLPLNALPLGLLVGIVTVKYFEKHQSNRKILYAVLLIIGVLSYFVPAGIVI